MRLGGPSPWMISFVMLGVYTAKYKFSSLSTRIIPVQPERENRVLHYALLDHILEDRCGVSHRNLREAKTLQSNSGRIDTAHVSSITNSWEWIITLAIASNSKGNARLTEYLLTCDKGVRQCFWHMLKLSEGLCSKPIKLVNSLLLQRQLPSCHFSDQAGEFSHPRLPHIRVNLRQITEIACKLKDAILGNLGWPLRITRIGKYQDTVKLSGHKRKSGLIYSLSKSLIFHREMS